MGAGCSYENGLRDPLKDNAKRNRKHRDTAASSQGATCLGSCPRDAVQYLEAKLLLKPDRFTSAQCFRDFGKRVEATAKKLGVPFIVSPKASGSPEIREIVFGDSADYRLYHHGFILRRRIRYRDGFPVGDPEVVFKFRDPDLATVAAMDVRPTVAGKCRIKLKMQALPLAHEVGGLRLRYSHNCVLLLNQKTAADDISMATLSRVFPALARLQKNDGEKVFAVNAAVVEEVSLELGRLSFGKGITAVCNVALWRTRGEQELLVGEFTYQAEFDPGKRIHDRAKKLCEQFFISLQFEVKEWVSLGPSKTAMVYHLNDRTAPSEGFGITIQVPRQEHATW